MRMKNHRDEIDRLEKDLDDLRRISSAASPDPDIERLRVEVNELKREFFSNLGAWQRTQLARHAQRPYMLDYVRLLFSDFSELHGDRAFGDDQALVTGMAKFHGRPVMVIGLQKGRDTKERMARESVSDVMLDSLKTLLLSKPGICSVELGLVYSDGKELRLGVTQHVRADRNLIEELQDLCGTDAVEVVRESSRAAAGSAYN